MASALRIAGLDRQSFRSNSGVFDVVLRGDKSEIRRLVQDGGEVARLYRLGVELNYAQVVHLGRQIVESIARERFAETPVPRKPLASGTAASTMLAYEMLAADEIRPRGSIVEVPAETERTPVSAIVGVPVIATNTAVPKPSSASRGTAVKGFLRDALARGPVAAKEIEQRAVEAGLLEDGKPIGGSKVFRTARSTLGVKTYQQPGQKSGGWHWSLPC